LKESYQASGTHCLETTEGETSQDTEEGNRARGTHCLETAEEKTSHDTERNQLSEGHSLPGDPQREGQSGHGKNATERMVLTSWRRKKKSGYEQKAT
jgi:hypothetical protein